MNIKKEIKKDFDYDLKNKLNPLDLLINHGTTYETKELEKDLRGLFEAIAYKYYKLGKHSQTTSSTSEVKR